MVGLLDGKDSSLVCHLSYLLNILTTNSLRFNYLSGKQVLCDRFAHPDGLLAKDNVFAYFEAVTTVPNKPVLFDSWLSLLNVP